MQTHKITHTNYELLVSKLLKAEPLPQDLSPDEKFPEKPDEVSFADFGPKKLPVNQQHLKNAWEASQRSTKEDWQEWIRRFSVELLKQSPSHALRACAGLAGIYYPLARDLFNAAFVSCWTELYDQFQEELVRSIETALVSPPKSLIVLNPFVLTEITFHLIELCIFRKNHQSQDNKRPDKHHDGVDEKKTMVRLPQAGISNPHRLP